MGGTLPFRPGQVYNAPVDETEGSRPVVKALLLACATGIALSIGASIGPDIVDRARVWIDRAMSRFEHEAIAAVEQFQQRAALEREVKQGTGPVIWEAMQIIEENQ